jgi:hypothetical protein
MRSIFSGLFGGGNTKETKVAPHDDDDDTGVAPLDERDDHDTPPPPVAISSSSSSPWDPIVVPSPFGEDVGARTNRPAKSIDSKRARTADGGLKLITARRNAAKVTAEIAAARRATKLMAKVETGLDDLFEYAKHPDGEDRRTRGSDESMSKEKRGRSEAPRTEATGYTFKMHSDMANLQTFASDLAGSIGLPWIWDDHASPDAESVNRQFEDKRPAAVRVCTPEGDVTLPTDDIPFFVTKLLKNPTLSAAMNNGFSTLVECMREYEGRPWMRDKSLFDVIRNPVDMAYLVLWCTANKSVNGLLNHFTKHGLCTKYGSATAVRAINGNRDDALRYFQNKRL